MAASGKTARQIVAEKGLAQVSDGGALEAEIDRLIAAHPDETARFKGAIKNQWAFLSAG